MRENVFTVMFYYVAETVLKKLLNKIKEQRSEAESERTQTTEATQENLGNLCVCVCVRERERERERELELENFILQGL